VGGGSGGKSMWQSEMTTTELTTDPNGKHAVYLCMYSTITETETPGTLEGEGGGSWTGEQDVLTNILDLQ
jgi:hypothetical protein